MTKDVPASLRTRLSTLARDVRDAVVSLELTVVLLLFSMVLVFAGTLDQVNLGIWAVQEKYFRSFLIHADVGGVLLPVFPGGYTVGGLLLVNLVAAHVFRFKFSWRKSGIMLTHVGLIVLLIGELLTGLWQEDFHLRLTEGETKNYAESFRSHELVVVDTTDAAFDDVVAIPEPVLAAKRAVQHPRLPFRLVPKSYYPNSALHVRNGQDGSVPAGAESADAGAHLAVAPQPVTHRTDERNVPSAILEVAGPDGTVGTFLVSAHLGELQPFTHAGRNWRIGLRLKRTYQPFSLTLLKFNHDRYAGTDIPKNFSSRLRLTTQDARENREVLVYMNNPLRHGGLTFYQAGFENNDRTTILQVVRNPSWLVPYIACALMTLGLTVQFTIHLAGFVRRRVAASASAPAVPSDAPAPRAAPLPVSRLPARAHP